MTAFTVGTRDGKPVVIEKRTNTVVHSYRKGQRKLAEAMVAKLNRG